MVRIGTGPFNRDRCGHTANHWLQIYNFIQNLAYNLQAYINKYWHIFFYKAKTNLMKFGQNWDNLWQNHSAFLERKNSENLPA